MAVTYGNVTDYGAAPPAGYGKKVTDLGAAPTPATTGGGGTPDYDALHNALTAFNFVLEVEAQFYVPLKSVKAFSKENEYEYIREGGVNDYVHLRRKPISKPFTFQVQRYVGSENYEDPLVNGAEFKLPLVLYIYKHKSKQGYAPQAPADPSRIYVFTGCTVINKEYGDLDAEKSSLLTETTTIAYRELIVLPNKNTTRY